MHSIKDISSPTSSCPQSTAGMSNLKTKDDLIQQAHQARKEREFARRRDDAALVIQAFMKACHVRAKLKRDAYSKLDSIIKSSQQQEEKEEDEKDQQQRQDLTETNLLQLFRCILFVSNPVTNRSTIDSLIQYILASSQSQLQHMTTNELNDSKQITQPSLETPENLIEEAIQESKLPPNERCRIMLETSTQLHVGQTSSNLIRNILTDANKDKALLEAWTLQLERILNYCIDYLTDGSSTRLDSQHIDTYLQILNLFTSKRCLTKALDSNRTSPITNDLNPNDDENMLGQLSEKLLVKTLLCKKAFFKSFTALLCEKINRFRNDLKASILRNYVHIALRLTRLESGEAVNIDQLDTSRRRDLCDTFITLLTYPGLIAIIKKHSNETLSNMKEVSMLKLILQLLAADLEFQNNLSSTASVYLLANLIHLGVLHDDVLSTETDLMVTVLTKALESCQKNMRSIASSVVPSSGASSGNKSKNSESKNVSFNPILGWLIREQATNVERDLIRAQLSHLWSAKFLKVLFKDLILYNEKVAESSQNNNSGKNSNYSKLKRNSLFSSATTAENSPQPTTQLPSITQTTNERVTALAGLGLIRRAVERATSNLNLNRNSNSSSYLKTSGLSGNSGVSKLLTPEAMRISRVCLMLHTALKTLTTLKQELLTGLCLHDYILINLWWFICSLGPHNGLKAFLEHLAIYTKTSAPEFHVLTLFCECSSHIISVLDDSELYERQKPFQLDDLIGISWFLNNFVFRVICNNLIPHQAHSNNTLTADCMDPILASSHKLLTDLYKRDCRRKFAPQDHWLIKDIKMSNFLKDLEAGKPMASTIMTMLPHIIPHKERVIIFKRLVARDKAQYCTSPSTLITINRSRIVEDGYQQLVRLPAHALKGLIRVKFINDYGLDEAGIDQDGVFKEFLEDTIKRVFDPALNLFCSTSEQRLYPSPTSRLHEDYLSLFNFVGKMLGKAVYEGIVVDVPFALFFLSRVLGQPQSPLYSPIDELPSLDPELYKSLTYIKHYEGDVSELELTFSIDQDFMGKIETHELEAGGKSMAVTRESRVRYIHSVANFRMKTQIEKQTEAFVQGFKSIVNLDWLTMFSASEFQRLISGDNTPIDLADLRRHTKYFGGFHNNHRVIGWLWDILERDFSRDELRLFLKFTTSCSKPPLLGFVNLEPPFSIRCVEVSDDQDLGDTMGSILRGFFAIRRSDPVDRLPTSSTCFNLLKLPNYQRRSTLRDKLRYAISSNPGFELS